MSGAVCLRHLRGGLGISPAAGSVESWLLDIGFHHIGTFGGGGHSHRRNGSQNDIGCREFPSAALNHPHPRLPPQPQPVQQRRQRSEERRVGKEFVSTCRSLWSQYHSKNIPLSEQRPAASYSISRVYSTSD